MSDKSVKGINDIVLDGINTWDELEDIIGSLEVNQTLVLEGYHLKFRVKRYADFYRIRSTLYETSDEWQDVNAEIGFHCGTVQRVTSEIDEQLGK